MRDNPCYQCEERHFLCHGECEAYKAMKERIAQEHAARDAARDLRDFSIDGVRKATAIQHRRRRK